MPSNNGIIALMGSGELTATMVEVHKALLADLSGTPSAVFLDTPAGFQLNVDQISDKAVDYFRTRVLHPMTVASFKANTPSLPFESQKALQTLSHADFVLIGPGSPSYAVRQLAESPIPQILVDRIRAGGCLVAASAAALTVGRKTLPVYEIYKVGTELHWLDGMDILGHFGFDLVVVPHWNNTEGGTHDTRYCYMGETRFETLEKLLSDDAAVLGIDEHTACIIYLARDCAEIKGLGRVILKKHGKRAVFTKGDRIPLDVLRGQAIEAPHRPTTDSESVGSQADRPTVSEGSFLWDRVYALKSDFEKSLDDRAFQKATGALLELDRNIWRAHQEKLEDDDTLSQAREILRDLLVMLVTSLGEWPQTPRQYLAPLVEELIRLRSRFRSQKNWNAADAVRDALTQADIRVEDTPEGTRWQLSTASPDQ